jgi:hypothetical protein
VEGRVRRQCAPACLVALDRKTAVHALFIRKTARLRMTTAGPGTIVSNPQAVVCGSAGSDCDVDVEQGKTLRLTPVPAPGGAMAAWGGSCRTATVDRCELFVTTDIVVSAAFRRTAPVSGANTLTVTLRGNGPVRSDPAGIDCPRTCKASFPAGTLVRLQAFRFFYWQ